MTNNTFSYNVKTYLGYKSSPTIEPDVLAADQWASSALTKNTDIPFVSSQKQLDSIYDLYNNDFDKKFANSLNIPINYQPELHRFMVDVLGYADDAELKMDVT